MSASPLRPAVVLVRPSEQGNVGAVARAMANMGLSRLIVVEPAVPIGEVARARAVGGEGILERVEHRASLAAALAPFARVVGTTSSRSRRLPASPCGPGELAPWLAAAPGARSALVFGPESSGLTNDELARCGLLVRIPAARRQPTLNLAQAVLILAYELALVRAAATGARPAGEAIPPGFAAAQRRWTAPTASPAPGDPPATTAEVAGLLAHAERTLVAAGFARDDTFPGVRRDLGRLAARAGLSRREVAILRGVCRRLEGRLQHGRGRGKPPAAG